MRNNNRQMQAWFRASACLVCGLAFFAAGAHAQPWPEPTDPYVRYVREFSRADTSEYYLVGQFLHSDDFEYKWGGNRYKFKFEDTGLGGFGVGYHMSEHLSARADFMFGSVNFSGQMPAIGGGRVDVRQNAFVHSGRFNVDYNLFRSHLTPFLTGGVGYQYMQTELTSLPLVSWYDPWYGWQTGRPIGYNTSLTGNVGAGIRWDVTRRMFLKAHVGTQWVGYNSLNNVTMQTEGFVTLGFKF